MTRTESRIAFTWLLVAAATMAGCGDSSNDGDTGLDDVRRAADKAVGTTGDYLAGKKDEFMTTVQSQLDDADEQLEKLKAKAAGLGDEARQQWEQVRPELGRKLEAARARLAEARDAGGQAWQDAKTGVEKAMDELKKAYEDAASRFDDES